MTTSQGYAADGRTPLHNVPGRELLVSAVAFNGAVAEIRHLRSTVISVAEHRDQLFADKTRLQAQVDALAGAELSNDEIDAIAAGIMEPLDTGDACEEDLDRKVLRRFARACIRAAIAAVGR